MKSSKRDLSVAIIGAGLGGIAAAIYIRRAVSADITIFEAEASIGGTWYRNRFPGAEVDTPSHMYSYSFQRHDWPRPYATQAELLDYMNGVVDKYGLRDLIRLSTGIRSVTWHASRQQYELVTTHGEHLWFDSVVSAVGMLSNPLLPSWAKSPSFRGRVFHSAQWPADVDLTGKRVAVVGTGSTAAQIVPAIAHIAAEVHLYQRQPGWVGPKAENVFTLERRTELQRPGAYRRLRMQEFWKREKRAFGGRLNRAGGKHDTAARAAAVERIAAVFAERPDLRAAVTPDYPYMGKRPIQSSVFYPSLLRENVRLHPFAVEELEGDEIIDASGASTAVDIVVCATGFTATEYLAGLPVVGEDGKTLQEVWAGEPEAFLGSVVPGFPNFFMLYGPNTNGYAVLFNLEHQARFAAASLKRMVAAGATTISVRVSVYDRYQRWLQKRLRATAYSKTRNYFTTASGRVVTQWPDGIILFAALTRTAASWGMSRSHREDRPERKQDR